MIEYDYAKIQLFYLVVELFYKAVAIQNIQRHSDVSRFHNLGGVCRGICRYLLEVHRIRIFAGICRRHGLGNNQFYELSKEI